jgi:hypothetical protein
VSQRKRGWDRRLWGAEKIGLGLLGVGWHIQRVEYYEAEPLRALLFTTRRAARAFCQQTNARYAAYPDWHVCRAWRFRPVRVRERVTVVT